MNKLRSKVFSTIFIILTISLLSFVCIYNIRNYIEQEQSIKNSLNVATNNVDYENKGNDFFPNPSKDFEKKDDNNMLDENIKFMDSTIYTILLDNNDNIKDVINRSNNELTDEEISSLATSLLKNENLKEKYIGCLYFSNYSYVYLKGKSLTIIDNTNIRKTLIVFSLISIFIFLLLEVVIYIVSRMITNWIIKPVNESFERQKQFIADASHELKTPLSVIMASADALMYTPNEIKWLKNIQTESERMNLLITYLLELSRSEKKDLNNFKVGNLSKVVELSILTFEGLAYEKNVKVNYKIDNDIEFMMDENNIKQLVEIILDNAIKHSKEGKFINIYLKNVNNNIEFIVENVGDEIPRGEEEKIFERFYRVDKSRNRNENRYGLGLAIAKNIVENHNGKISAFSNNGVTTFRVLFKK